jgi:hypothetical protein
MIRHVAFYITHLGFKYIEFFIFDENQVMFFEYLKSLGSIYESYD